MTVVNDSVTAAVYGSCNARDGLRAGLPDYAKCGQKLGGLIAVAVFALTAASGVSAASGHKQVKPVLHSKVSVSTTGAKSVKAAGQPTATGYRYARFSGEVASDQVKYLADWVADSRDNRNMHFVILDKKNARLFVFDPQAKLLGTSPVLLGVAVGDHTVPDIGKRPIAQIKPHERTTPAGRFLAEPGHNASGKNVVWVDYDAVVSMHRVLTTNPVERRLERLNSPTSADNRISYGCINVPVWFFESVLSPAFNQRYGVVYVVPEVKHMRDVFPAAYDPGRRFAKTMPNHVSRTAQKHPRTPALKTVSHIAQR